MSSKRGRGIKTAESWRGSDLEARLPLPIAELDPERIPASKGRRMRRRSALSPSKVKEASLPRKYKAPITASLISLRLFLPSSL
jgi:hypothetical protein